MRFQKAQRTSQEFQLAPMVDVLFILLIFFIVTTSYQALERELSIALPDAEHSTEIEQGGRDILININRNGEFIVNRKPYTLEGLRDLLIRTKNILGSRAILIRADQETLYDHIVKVMDLCAELKMNKISFVTQKDDSV